MPAKSKAQFRAMAAAAHGDSDAISIDPKKAKEYLTANYDKIPEHTKKKPKPKAKG